MLLSMFFGLGIRLGWGRRGEVGVCMSMQSFMPSNCVARRESLKLWKCCSM